MEPLTGDELQTIGTPSIDHVAMEHYWRTTTAIIDGIVAIRAGRDKWLPKFPNESETDYKYRLSTSRFTNVYRDVVENLASKPFEQECRIMTPEEDSPEGDDTTGSDSAKKVADVDERLITIAGDIDARGNSLHVFAAEVFFHGINSAIDWILVEFPEVDRTIVRSVNDEKNAGVRPYWVRVPALNVYKVVTKIVGGKERIVEARIYDEDEKKHYIRRWVRDDTGKVEVQIYEKPKASGIWTLARIIPISIDVIPLVPFMTGRRKGSSFQLYPPLRDAADLQIELYQSESGLKNTRTLTCFPMLAANGVSPDKDAEGKAKPVPVGPNAVLYAPMSGSGQAGAWERLEADAASLVFLASDIESDRNQLRELGRQPLTAQSGNVTRINSAMAANKGNTAVAAWTLTLKDALELAFQYTAKWLDITFEADAGPEVFINTDFGVPDAEDKGPEHLLKMREGGNLSQDTLWVEMKRRNVLSSSFDPVKEKELLANEYPEGDEMDVDPLTGLPIKPAPGTPPIKPVPGKPPVKKPPAVPAAT